MSSTNKQSRKLVVVLCTLALATWWSCKEVQASGPSDSATPQRRESRRASALGNAGGMWFGPRLGRRLKRNLQLPNAQLARQLVDLVEEAPWLLLAIDGSDLVSEGKRHTVNFTPRLGRESGEEVAGGGSMMLQAGGASSSDRWLLSPAAADQSSDLMAQRSPPFAPRLGRARY